MDEVKSPETPQIKLHFLDYWRIIRIRKAVILTVFLLVVLTATLVTFVFLPVQYSSTVRISVEKDIGDVGGIGNTTPTFLSHDPFWLQTQFEIIQSSSVLYDVIKKLDLTRRWTEKYSPEQALRTEDVYDILKNVMRVRQYRNTSIIEISVYSDNPNEAAEIANTIADVYRDSRLKLKSEFTTRGIETLKGQLAEKEEEVKRAQQIVNEMRQKGNIDDIADGTATLGAAALLNTETLRRLEQARSEARQEYITFNTMLEKIKAINRADLKSALPTAYPQDQYLPVLLKDLDLAERQLAMLLQDFSREHPDVKRAQVNLDTTQKHVDDRVNGILLGLETRVAQAKAKLSEIESDLEESRNRGNEQLSVFRPYFDAKRNLENVMRVRDALVLKISQEEIDAQIPRSSIVQVTDPATPGLRPVRPNKPLNIALGMVVGLIVGIGLAFFIEYLDTSVKTIDDVERALQAPVLGVIPQNVGTLLHEGPESPHAEAYRVLRTNILFSRKDPSFNTATIVSGGVGEGKSTTLMNLATIFAQLGSRVLVVDSDLRRPSLHKILRVSNSIGLTNYLLRQNTLEEVIQTTQLPMLDFMPSGKLPSSSMGILSSAQMKELISELKRRYDFVFFDSPPIMGVSDASILASSVDMALQVIQYRRYPQPMTIRAKQMIQKVGGNLVGIVLNNINMSQDENYYYYSGYYDYYSKQNDDSVVKPATAQDSQAGEPAKLDLTQKY